MTPKILISQPRPQTEKSPYFDLEKKYGVEIVFRPFIKVEPMEPKDFRAQKVSIPGHTAIVFTSRHGIDHFFSLCKELGMGLSLIFLLQAQDLLNRLHDPLNFLLAPERHILKYDVKVISLIE